MAVMLVTSVRETYDRVAKETGKIYSMDKVARDYAALYENMLAERAY